MLGHAVLQCLCQGHHQLSLRIRKQQGKIKPHFSDLTPLHANHTLSSSHIRHFLPPHCKASSKETLGYQLFPQPQQMNPHYPSLQGDKASSTHMANRQPFPSIHSSILWARTERELRKGRQVTLQQDPFRDI